jgi:hypothetical protein
MPLGPVRTCPSPEIDRDRTTTRAVGAFAGAFEGDGVADPPDPDPEPYRPPPAATGGLVGAGEATWPPPDALGGDVGVAGVETPDGLDGAGVPAAVHAPTTRRTENKMGSGERRCCVSMRPDTSASPGSVLRVTAH